MDAQALRRVLFDFFKFNTKDFYVQGSGTGYAVSLAKQNPSTFVQPPGPVNIFVIERSLYGQGGVTQFIFPANYPAMVAAIPTVEATADSTTQTSYAASLATGKFTNGSTFSNPPFDSTFRSAKEIIAYYSVGSGGDEYAASTGEPFVSGETSYKIQLLVFADVVPVKLVIGYKWQKTTFMDPYTGSPTSTTTTLTDSTFTVSIFGNGQPVDIPNAPDITMEAWPSVLIPPIGTPAPVGIQSNSGVGYKLTITSIVKA